MADAYRKRIKATAIKETSTDVSEDTTDPDVLADGEQFTIDAVTMRTEKADEADEEERNDI